MWWFFAVALGGDLASLSYDLREGVHGVPSLRVEYPRDAPPEVVRAAVTVARDRWVGLGLPSEVTAAVRDLPPEPDALRAAEAGWSLALGKGHPMVGAPTGPTVASKRVDVQVAGPWIVVTTLMEEAGQTRSEWVVLDHTAAPARLEDALTEGGDSTIERLAASELARQAKADPDRKAPKETGAYGAWLPTRSGVALVGATHAVGDASSTAWAIELPWDVIPLAPATGALVDAWRADASPEVLQIGAPRSFSPVALPALSTAAELEHAWRLLCVVSGADCSGDPKQAVSVRLLADAKAGRSQEGLAVTGRSEGALIQLDAVGGTASEADRHVLLGEGGRPVPFPSLFKDGALPKIAAKVVGPVVPDPSTLACGRSGAMALVECEFGWTTTPEALVLAFVGREGAAGSQVTVPWRTLAKYLGRDGPGRVFHPASR